MQKRNIPYITIILVTVNVIAYIVMMISDPAGESVFQKYGDSYDMVFEQHQWWRIITAMFSHGSTDHLMGNMGSLLAIGSVIESDRRMKFTVSYFLTGVIASIGSMLIRHYSGTDALSIGASGAVCGLIGYYIAMTVIYGGFSLQNIARPLIAVALIVFSGTDDATIDLDAHVAGLIAGIIIGAIFEANNNSSGRKKTVF